MILKKKYYNKVDDINEPDYSIASLPLAKEFKAFLTPKLYLIQMKEFNKALGYDHKEKSQLLGSEVYDVWFLNSEQPVSKIHEVSFREKIVCDCKYFERMGLVCKHILHMCVIKNVKSLEQLRIMARWRQNLDYLEILHFTNFDYTRNILTNERRILDLECRDNPIENIRKEESSDDNGNEQEDEDEENGNKKKVVQNFNKKKNNKGAPPKRGKNFFIRD